MKNNELFPLASERPESKSLARMVRQYSRYWYLFILSFGICLGLAYGYLKYYAVPEYSITSTILIKEDNSKESMSSGGFDLNMFGSSKNLNNELEVLESKGLMERVVASLDLTTKYYQPGRFSNIELYGSNLPIRVIKSKLSTELVDKTLLITPQPNGLFVLEDNITKEIYHFGQVIHKPYGYFTIVADSTLSKATEIAQAQIIVEFHALSKVAGNYRQCIQIAPVGKEATVLQVTMTDALPERGRNVVNKLIEVYNNEALEDKNLTATNTIRFLNDRLNFLTGELSGVEKTVERYKSQNGVTDVTAQATNYLEQASDYNKKLADWDTQIEVLKSIEQYLTSDNGQYKLVPSTLGIQDQTLLGLIGKFNELQLDRERLLRTTEPGNPYVVNDNQQLASLKVNILENLRNIKSGLVITSNNLRANSGQFKSRIQKVPVLERELQVINRQQETKQKLYLYLLQKREEAGLSLAATVSNTRIIDSAASTDYPIRPSKQIIYLVALLAGFLIPFAVIYSKDLLNDKVEYQQDVEERTTTPVIGELAHNTQGHLVMTKGNRSPLAEMFRLIRTNLQFAANGQDYKTIMVTSSMSHEGKTFFSLNLAATLVLTGKRVVVLEMDLRKPALLQLLDITQKVGITDYILSDSISIANILYPVQQVPDLFVIGAGQPVANPAELMMTSKLGYLLHELRETFDYVIIDTAPIGKVSDAFSLRNYIDQTVYIVRYNYTLKKQLDIVDNVFVNSKLPNTAIVLNDARSLPKHSYGYGYEESSKKSLFSRAVS